MMENDDLAEADELVVLQELYLKSLVKRKALLIMQRGGMEHNLTVHRMELPWLQTKESNLKLARLKHVKLRMEIQKQLQKSEERLKHFPSDVLDQVEDVASESSSDEIVLATNVQGETVMDVESGLPANQSTNNEPDPLSSLPPSSNPPRPAPSMLSASIENPFAEEKGVFSLFRIQQNSNHLVLHPMLHGEALVKFMDLSIQDFLSMDQERPMGNHRREALFQTCLFPFSMDSGDDPFANVDQDIEFDTFCPYEMSGDCNDQYCRYMHFKERKLKSLRRIKEMIPMPDINLPATLGQLPQKRPAETDIVSKKQKLEVALDDNDRGAENVPSIEFSYNSQVDTTSFDPNEHSIPNYFDFDKDFVSFPIETGGKDEVGDDNNQPQSEMPDSWWMDDDDRQRIVDGWKEGNQMTLLTYINMVFCIHQQGDCLVCQVAYHKLDELRVIRLLGRLVNALQLFLHSGRFDFAKSACCMLEDLCLKYIGVSPCRRLQPFFASLSQTWNLNDNKSNIFAVAVEQQTLLFSIQRYLSILHSHIVCCSRSLTSWCYDALHQSWDDLLVRIVDLFAMPKIFIEQYRQGHALEHNDRRLESMSCNETFKSTLALAEFVAVTEEMAGRSCSLNDLDSRLSTIRHSFEECQVTDEHFELQRIAQVLSLATTIDQVLREHHGTGEEHSILPHKLDVVSFCLSSESCVLSKMDACFLLTPILALQVSFLMFNRKYHKALLTLEEFVDRQMSLWSFSDLLWSQVTMLRSIFPTHKKLSRSVPNDLPKRLSSVISRLGIRLNYLSLVGDHTLFHPFRNGDSSRRKRIRWKANVSMLLQRIQMMEGAGQMGPLIEMLDLETMPIGSGVTSTEVHDSISLLTFPRSLLLGGFSLRRLKLSHCQIQILPQHFGNHFPSLQDLMLDNNRLSTLPSSFGSLASLVTLDLSFNRVSSLPARLGECLILESLLVRDNQLTSLPDEINGCTKLQTIDLTNNRIEKIPDSLVVHIESLVFVNLEGNPCDENGLQ